MQRRRFLGALGAGSMAGSMGTMLAPISRISSKQATEDLIIEWNAHIFSPDLERYPFHPQARYTPNVAQNSADPLSDYLQHMDDNGIDRAVIVHPEPYGDDHRLILECLEREPDRLRGTSLYYPRDSKAPSKLKQLVKLQPRIVATRFHALKGNEAYMDSFADEGVTNLWRQAYDLDLVIELHIGPDYAAQATQLLRQWPDSKVLIDHLAEPHLGHAVEYADVLEMAQFPNCYMKLSGLNHFAQDAPLYHSAKAFTQRVIAEFGPDRVVWGSGTPDIVDAHMPNHSQVDIAKVKGGNIRQLLQW